MGQEILSHSVFMHFKLSLRGERNRSHRVVDSFGIITTWVIESSAIVDLFIYLKIIQSGLKIRSRPVLTDLLGIFLKWKTKSPMILHLWVYLEFS